MLTLSREPKAASPVVNSHIYPLAPNCTRLALQLNYRQKILTGHHKRWSCKSVKKGLICQPLALSCSIISIEQLCFKQGWSCSDLSHTECS